MATTPPLQQEWDQAQPQTPEQEWESAAPAPPSETKNVPQGTISIDPKALTQSLIYSKTLDVPPKQAYDQRDQIEKEMQSRGAGSVWDIANDIKVGGESSIFGMAWNRTMPEHLNNPTKANEFVSGLATMIADLPVYIFGGALGAVAGAAAGSEVPGVGNVVGAAAGADMGTFAVPDAIRKALVEGIEKGNIKSFGDLVDRTAGVAFSGAKGAATGLTMGAAGAATPFTNQAAAKAAKFAQQAAAITILPKVLEGQLPTASDFGVNAALMGALHLVSMGYEIGTGKARQGLMDVYAKDGTSPEDAAKKLQAQPPVKTDLEPGLRPAIQFTRAAGSDMPSTEVSAGNSATSGKVVLEAEDGEDHYELSQRMLGQMPTTFEELESDPSLASKVLANPDTHEQEVIDRAAQLKREAPPAEGEEPYDQSTPKSGHGFITPDGKFLNRVQAKSWVKQNEPEIHEMWAEILGDDKEEFRSEDYALARDRVANRNLAEGDPDLAQWSPQFAQEISRMRSELNDIKAGDQSAKYGKSVIRTLFVGTRNFLLAEGNQLQKSIGKLIPDEVDQGALSFYRDWKGDPEGLRSANEEIGAGDNEKLKASLPARERALSFLDKTATPSPDFLKADQRMTDYFTNRLGLGRQLGFLESSIDPERYSPRLFTKTLEGDEEARSQGGSRFTTSTPNAIRRKYLNEYDALKSGEFEARTFNAIDELGIYNDRFSTAAATSILKTELKNTELGKVGSRENHSSNWVLLPGTQKPIIIKDAKTGESRIMQQGFYVPPIVSDAMRPILEQNVLSDNTFFKGVRNTQRYLKSAMLGFSVFHMKAETFMAFNNMKWTSGDFIKMLRAPMDSPEFDAGEREGAFDGLETTMTGRSGAEGLSATESILPAWKDKPGIKQIDEAAHAMTYTTFDLIQRKYKVNDYMLKKAAWLGKHPDASDVEVGIAGRSIAKEVNAVYGGLNWEVMGVSQNWREITRAIILAPDWTFSNLANLKYAFEGGPGGNAARMFWFRSFVTGATLTQATSLMLSGQLSKHFSEVYMGTDKKTGKEIYSNIFFAGAPRDAITWFNSVQRDGGLQGTVDFMAFKAAPLLGIVPRLMINRDWTGRPITTPKEGVVEKTARQAGFAAEEAAPAPFVLKDIIEGMLNNSEQDYTYKDFLLAIAGATARHEGGKGKKSRGKFSILGR